MAAQVDVKAISATVGSLGYALVKGGGARAIQAIADAWGGVLRTDDVVVVQGARALLKTAQAIPLHTDHHRAKWIAWHCVKQTSAGGETVLADGLAGLLLLNAAEQYALRRVVLQEHRVFEHDRGAYPLVSLGGDRGFALYYAPWLLPDLDRAQRAAVTRLDDVVNQEKRVLRMEAGDVLVVDNRRVLHGRTAIEGDGQRHLWRVWIGEQ